MEYPYNYAHNLLLLRISIIPLIFGVIIYHVYHRIKPKTYVIIMAIIGILFILGLEQFLLGKRFTAINPETLTLQFINGNTVKLDQNNIKHFWPVSQGRTIRTTCYLWVQRKKDGSYRSMNIGYNDQCIKDAAYLNQLYDK